MRAISCGQKTRLLIVLILALLSSAPAKESALHTDEDSLIKKVDELFAQWNKPDTPGCALAIIKDGKLVYKRGYGMADLERDIPITSMSVFDIGSTSKQFTAMSILLLAKQGKLSLDDDIHKYIPEIRKYENPITIRHLIHHTSGIRDYLALMYLAGMRYENEYSEDEVIHLLARQKELNFKPGDEHLYSNSGYFLLSVIVKRASGKSLREFAEEHIFKPLGMKNTHFHDDFTMIVKNRAVGYSPKPGGGYRIDMSLFDVVGDGALMTTVEDLFLWDQNFYENKLGGGGQELIEQLLTPGTLNNGKKLDYAFGLGIGQYKGLKMISHGGAWAGYRAEMIRFPEQKFSVICLSNLGSFNPTGLAKQVADIYLADQFKPELAKGGPEPAAKAEFITLPESELKDKSGTFRNPVTGTIWTLSVQDGKLMVKTSADLVFHLAPTSQNTFQAVGAPVGIAVTFETQSNDQPMRLRVSVEGREPSTFEPIQLISPTLAQLNEYVGEYYSDELDVSYKLFIKDGKLFVKIKTNPEDSPLEPTVSDEFNMSGVTVKFVRNSQTQISGFSLKAGRVKNIRFAKTGAPAKS